MQYYNKQVGKDKDLLSTKNQKNQKNQNQIYQIAFNFSSISSTLSSTSCGNPFY